jgi:hypothetical protein
MDGLSYSFSDVIKLWVGNKSTWHYVSLLQAMSDEIHTLSQYHQTKRRGWGAVKVDVVVQHQQWQTSIFPAFEDSRYALFLKADIRKQLGVAAGSEIAVTLTLLW